MKFIIGEDWISFFERLKYRGIIGIAYESTFDGVLAYIIFGLICLFAVIGVINTIKFIFFGRKKKEDPHQKWLRTGKM